MNPGEFDYKKYQRELGIMRYADYEVQHSYKEINTTLIYKLSPQRFAINTRVALTKLALKLQTKHSALFLTLTIGNTTMLSKSTRDNFRLTGTLHLLVISGLHIGFLVLILELLLKFFRVSQRTKAIILLLLLIFYWLIVGYKISITRAIIIGIIYYLGQLFRRQVKFTNVLAA
ncbi:MAG: ComEC/Rec2 family competence protein, partial [Planctomycetes bacterium]|nr:ComEC/Rec2 family competence protein [Planctomycetota bacterium]